MRDDGDKLSREKSLVGILTNAATLVWDWDSERVNVLRVLFDMFEVAI